jgi:hypothetical protein
MHLLRHVMQHPFSCSTCGKGFKYEHTLAFHEKQHSIDTNNKLNLKNSNKKSTSSSSNQQNNHQTQQQQRNDLLDDKHSNRKIKYPSTSSSKQQLQQQQLHLDDEDDIPNSILINNHPLSSKLINDVKF